MSEKVSILLVMPSGSGQSTEAQETLQGISAQTYPTELTEVIKVEYMPFEPGANTSALNAGSGAGHRFVPGSRAPRRGLGW